MTELFHLSDRDVSWVVRRLPKPVKELLESRSDIFLAGGFIRSCIAGEEVKDIDLFAPDKETAKIVADSLAAGGDVYTTDNAHTVVVHRVSVQVIHRWTFTSPRDCMMSFDFTIAQAAIWFSNGWMSACHKDYYADLAAKRLVYTSPSRIENVGGSMLRVIKFVRRGYIIPLDSLGAVVARLTSGVDYSKIRQYENSEDYSEEIRVAEVLTGLLVEVDPSIAIQMATG